ncbi:MAG: hypothetical protein APR63_09185 [Desulfuromonas sp. SDB]|nr:MAG: hypothetical protein APR63_09185 [Desulfuromonas sp. SDB]
MHRNSWLILTAILFAFPGYIFADAGYMASVTSGASPLMISGTEHPGIEMSAEEVVILISTDILVREAWEVSDEQTEIYKADIYSSFLFTNTGEADRVLMAIPVESATPTVPWVYGQGIDSTLFTPVVMVDGQPVEVKLIYGYYPADDIDSGQWNEVLDKLDPVYDSLPQSSQFLFFRNYVYSDPDYSVDFIQPKVALACWEVSFNSGQQRLVEYHEEYEMTSDYGMKTFRLTYPLFTGATWKGPIGEGKISVIMDSSFVRDDLQYYLGILLPEPEEIENGSLDLENFLSRLENPQISQLADFNNLEFSYGIIWEFNNFEPIPSGFSYQDYYMDSEIFYYTAFDSYIDTPNHELSPPWFKSRIYLYLGEVSPHWFIAVNEQGVPVYSQPDQSSVNIIDTIGPMTSVEAFEIDDNWIKAEIHEHDTDNEIKGWIPLYYYNEDGLLEVNLILIIGTDY